MITPADVAAAGQLACLLEVSAPKPGNVSPDRHFHDTRYEDFLASAVAIGPAFASREAPAGHYHTARGGGYAAVDQAPTPTSALSFFSRRWHAPRC